MNLHFNEKPFNFWSDQVQNNFCKLQKKIWKRQTVLVFQKAAHANVRMICQPHFSLSGLGVKQNFVAVRRQEFH